MNMTPRDFLGFTTSTVFVIVFLWLIFNALGSLDSTWLHVLAFSVLGPTVLAWPVFLGFKLYGMFLIDKTPDKAVRRTTKK